ncbi:MAG: glycosyltransferase [Patescibacteria group bacterium]
MKNKIIIISSYPEKNQIHGSKTVGGASYTKNLLIKMKRNNPDLSITVLAEMLNRDTESYKEKEIRIERIWKRNSPTKILTMIGKVFKNPIKRILISYEINMMGGVLTNIIFLISLLALKVTGKDIYFLPHQVPGNFGDLEQNKFKIAFLNLFKNLFFIYVSLISKEVIVFEDKFKEFLPLNKNASVIPLAIEKKQLIDQDYARSKLGLDKNSFYILFFGFLSPYKGIDRLLNIYKPNFGKLIVAGDTNPNHTSIIKYMEFVSNVKKEAREKDAIVTGFVKENEIDLYFAACNLVILPYRMFFSSSYPMALAFTANKPVLFSKPLEGYFQSEDFKSALIDSGLTKDQFIFDFNSKNLSKKINFLKKNNNKTTKFIKHIKNNRSWENIIYKFSKLLEIM